ncbi:MAG: flagellar biosynthetic protein FliO [Limnochordaceae bacterium]|uniref:Flagellar biosynthetic protein FliO n=1 Tax=Carboxydichorda subterranea TaxID=3109565 RepID=A0ABZ1C048_9FIRM|nr:flagellar biosynthetic protein FliO [Limnochorda sp. L945t]MBE3598012.1 flagellar biosynthetic protein FliO [Limnochordaceae bacterium]WRP18459.1 flagellar biosynthetic protein FliO [Limnochorda sp. L945t]
MEGGVGWGDVLRVVGALALLGPLAYLASRAVASRGLARSSRILRVVDTLALGQGKALYLVAVGHYLLLVGLSGQTIRRLATWDDPALWEHIHAASSRGTPGDWLFRRAPWGRGKPAGDAPRPFEGHGGDGTSIGRPSDHEAP